MSIISSKHRLVKVSNEGDKYSAGPGIVIEDSTISVDPNLSAVIDGKLDISSFSSYSATIDDELQYVSANAGNTYSAGDNIDIYEQDNDLYISAKDWTTDIANASSYAFNEATAQIPPAFDPTYISGQIDNKLNKSDFETYSGTVNTQITGLSGEVQTTSSILSAAVDYLSGNAGKTYNGIAPIVVNNTTDEISADTQDITFGIGLDFTNNILSVTAQGADPEVESVVRTNSADWGTITALSSTSSLLDNKITAVRNDLNTVTTNTGYLHTDIQTTSGILSGAIDYVSANLPEGFTGINHDNNLSGDGNSIPIGLASSIKLQDPSIYTTATYGGSVSIEGIMPRIQLKTNNSSYNTLGEGGMTVTHPASSVGGGYTTSHYGEKMSLSYNDGDYYLHTVDTTKSGLGVTYNGAPNVKAYYNYSGVALTNDNGATNEYVNVDSIRNWNSVYDTVESNSGSWTGGGGGSIDTIPIVAISPLVTGFSGESAYLGIESTALNLSSYVPVSSIGYNSTYISTISGKTISSYTGRYAMTANYANTADRAYHDRNNNEITSYYQPKLNIVGDAGTITAINGSAVGASIPEGWELVGSAGISILDDSANNQTIISVTGGGGAATLPITGSSNNTTATYDSNSAMFDYNETQGEPTHNKISINPDPNEGYITIYNSSDGDETNTTLTISDSYIQFKDAEDNFEEVNGSLIDSWNDATTAYQTNSGNYLTAHQPISAEEWNSNYDTVNTNSATWNEVSGKENTLTFEYSGAAISSINGSALLGESIPFEIYGISAGDNIGIWEQNNALWISGKDWSNDFYAKTDTSSKTELDAAIGNIESLLASL